MAFTLVAMASTLVASLLLVAMPFAPRSFLFLVVRPGAPSSVLAPRILAPRCGNHAVVSLEDICRFSAHQAFRDAF